MVNNRDKFNEKERELIRYVLESGGIDPSNLDDNLVRRISDDPVVARKLNAMLNVAIKEQYGIK